MSETFDCSQNADLLAGMRRARAALGAGDLVVLPTDTVYGVAADAFTPDAVAALLQAKGRGRQSPPPVLIPDLPTLDALAETVPEEVRNLVEAFWPGGLTVILPARPSLAWDLGETRGTVALRMPDDTIALEILKETGPLAVSSANLTGVPAAATAAEAHEMLGDAVAVYLEAGARPIHPGDSSEVRASTIIDATALVAGRGGLRILRHGAISDERIRQIVGAALDESDATETGESVAEDDDGAEVPEESGEAAVPEDAGEAAVPEDAGEAVVPEDAEPILPEDAGEAALPQTADEAAPEPVQAAPGEDETGS